MSTVSLANRLRGWSASIGPRWSMMRSAADFETPNSGASWRMRQVRAPVRRDQQYPVLQRQAPRPAPADRVRAFAPQGGHQLAEAARAQPGERGYPGRLRRRDHTSHSKIIPCGGVALGDVPRNPMVRRSFGVKNRRMHEVKLSDGIITLSPLRLDDVEAHLTGEDELLVRWLNGGPGTREGVEEYFQHCWEQWDTAGPLRAFGIRVGADEALAGTIDLRFAGEGLTPGQVNVAYGLYPSWRGRGLATRAVILASQYAASEGGEEAVIQVEPENPASAAVARRAEIHPRQAAAQQGRHTVRLVHPGPARRSPVTTSSYGTTLSGCVLEELPDRVKHEPRGGRDGSGACGRSR